MFTKFAFKLALFLSSLFPNSFRERRFWYYMLRAVDTGDMEEITPASKWILKHGNWRVKVASFIVYFAYRDPLFFVLSVFTIFALVAFLLSVVLHYIGGLFNV